MATAFKPKICTTKSTKERKIEERGLKIARQRSSIFNTSALRALGVLRGFIFLNPIYAVD
jgi:hypothetical protein